MSSVSIFDIFKIGIGPSSSHTVGPMKAARAFAEQLEPVVDSVAAVRVNLHGSLAYTGKGHGTDSAVLLGLMGLEPETIDPDAVDDLLRTIHTSKTLNVLGVGELVFDPELNIIFDRGEELPRHTNGMHFVASDAGGATLIEEKYYSLGGGFIARGDEPEAKPLLRVRLSTVLLVPAANSKMREVLLPSTVTPAAREEASIVRSRSMSICPLVRVMV